MCPSHPEHFVDWKMVSSISATERVKLWDQFSGPVDQETVKTDFFRRVHRKSPPYRIKLKPKPRVCAEIPPMVEFHYRHPPQLIPSLRDVLRCEKVYKNGFRYELTNTQLCKQLDDDLSAFEEARQRIGVVAEEDKSDEDTKADEMSAEHPTAEDQPASANKMANTDVAADDKENGEKIEEEPTHIQNIEEKTETATDMETEDANGEPLKNGLDDTAKTEGVSSNGPTLPPNRKRMSSVISLGTEAADELDIPRKIFAIRKEKAAEIHIDHKQIKSEMEHLDENVIQELAFQQLQQILSENSDLVAKYQMDSANGAIREALRIKAKKITLPSQLLSKDDIAKIAEEFKSPPRADTKPGESNGWHRDDEDDECLVRPFMPPPDDGLFYTNGLTHISDEVELSRAIAQRLKQPLRDSKVRARAILTPVDDILRGRRYVSYIRL